MVVLVVEGTVVVVVVVSVELVAAGVSVVLETLVDVVEVDSVPDEEDSSFKPQEPSNMAIAASVATAWLMLLKRYVVTL